eukprot:7201068-Heterocapsa_arctica.AAC.1
MLSHWSRPRDSTEFVLMRPPHFPDACAAPERGRNRPSLAWHSRAFPRSPPRCILGQRWRPTFPDLVRLGGSNPV